jgi:NAD(P)-dependent dehydrogenase (short-subunit alcohol dehydrogenase family)
VTKGCHQTRTLRDRVALVTGGSSGIGLATARLLACEGARVALLARGAEALERAVESVTADGGEAMAVTADVSRAQQMEEAVDQVIDRWDRLHIVFANAGINGVWAPVEDLEPDEWQKTISVNLTGTFLTLKAALPHLKRQGGAVIITSSVEGTHIFSSTGATAYSCSKAGQVALGKMAALELAEHGVRVNVICPGWIGTGITTEKHGLEGLGVPVEYPEGIVPLTGGEPGRPEDVARLVLFLASDASRHITGTAVVVDGAQSLLVG